MEPESGFIRALNALWDEVEKGAGRARALFSRPETKKVLIGAALALSTLAFLTPLEITGRLRGGGGARVGSTVGAGERIFVSPHERGRSRLRGGPSGSGASLQSAGPNRKESEERTSAQAVAPPSARAIADLSEVGSNPRVGRGAIDRRGGAGRPMPRRVRARRPRPRRQPPLRPLRHSAVVTAAPSPGSGRAARGRAPPLGGSRGFSSSQPTKIAASSLSRLGTGRLKVEATQTRSSFESEGAGAGGASIGGGQAEASLGSSPGGRADAAAARRGGGRHGGGGTGGMAENGSGPGIGAGSWPTRKNAMKRRRSTGPSGIHGCAASRKSGTRGGHGPTCKNRLRQGVLRGPRLPKRAGLLRLRQPACVREICEPRRLSSMTRPLPAATCAAISPKPASRPTRPTATSSGPAR